MFGIENLGNCFNIKTVTGNIETKSIIISTGDTKVKPNIPGIQEYEGKGISYCAICDAFFYKNKNVAILGNGEFAISEAKELSHLASKVIILSNGQEVSDCGFELNDKRIKRFIGNNKLDKVEFEDGSCLDIDGVFVALGVAGASDFAKELGVFQNNENIRVNENMETNVNGVFACGNITGGLKQICKAVHEGAIAGLSAVKYIRDLKGE